MERIAALRMEAKILFVDTQHDFLRAWKNKKIVAYSLTSPFLARECPELLLNFLQGGFYSFN
jgi:hypothetical protein